jgi:hypothetical protein
VTPEVQTAVEEIRQTFAGHRVDVEEESQGGAYVIVHDLVVGERYTPTTSWFGFLITFQYPRADVYPHFMDGALCRMDGKSHPTGISGPTQWQSRSVLQISRKSNRWNPAVDTAAAKLLKVLDWVKSL